MEGNATMQLGAVPTDAKDNTTIAAPNWPNTMALENGTIKRRQCGKDARKYKKWRK